MEKKKLTLGYLLLLALPGAFLEVLNNVYNSYTPIFLQAGNPDFASTGTTLTFGFGVGAAIVGLWMVADNLWGFIAMPVVGAWSDRSRSKMGRRLPFVLWTLPLVIIGYVAISIVPTLIPPELSGQMSRLTGYFVLFTLACVVFYLGFTPVRVILQTIRQEGVEPKDRTKVESWWMFGINLFTIIALTGGSYLYKIYGPLLFWVVLIIYIVVALVLVTRYKEPPHFMEIAEKQEGNAFKQIFSVFKGISAEERRNLIFFLVSVFFSTLSGSSYTNFGSSWVVNQIGVDESQAASITSIMLIAATIVVLPAGYLASGKFGKRNMYLTGLLIMYSSVLFVVVIPSLYLLGFVILGIGYGASFACQVPIVSSLSRKEGNLGAVLGLYNLAYLVGFVLGSLIIGSIIQATSYAMLFPACFVLGLGNLAFFLFVKVPKE